LKGLIPSEKQEFVLSQLQ